MRSSRPPYVRVVARPSSSSPSVLLYLVAILFMVQLAAPSIDTTLYPRELWEFEALNGGYRLEWDAADEQLPNDNNNHQQLHQLHQHQQPVGAADATVASGSTSVPSMKRENTIVGFQLNVTADAKRSASSRRPASSSSSSTSSSTSSSPSSMTDSTSSKSIVPLYNEAPLPATGDDERDHEYALIQYCIKQSYSQPKQIPTPGTAPLPVDVAAISDLVAASTQKAWAEMRSWERHFLQSPIVVASRQNHHAEQGVWPDDPTLAITWPLPPIVSSNPSALAAMSRARTRDPGSSSVCLPDLGLMATREGGATTPGTIAAALVARAEHDPELQQYVHKAVTERQRLRSIHVLLEPFAHTFAPQPLGAPKSFNFTLWNTHPSRPLTLLSLSTESLHYHSALADALPITIEPLQHLHIPVVFLPRIPGFVGDYIRLETNRGAVLCTMFGFSIASPYRLKPLINYKVPAGVLVRPAITLYNYHPFPISVSQMYITDDNIQLELPHQHNDHCINENHSSRSPSSSSSSPSSSSSSSSTKSNTATTTSSSSASSSSLSCSDRVSGDVWVLQPGETRTIAHVRFVANTYGLHRGLVSLFLSTNEMLVVHCEFSVVLEGLHMSPEFVNFGTLLHIDQPTNACSYADESCDSAIALTTQLELFDLIYSPAAFLAATAPNSTSTSTARPPHASQLPYGLLQTKPITVSFVNAGERPIKVLSARPWGAMANEFLNITVTHTTLNPRAAAPLLDIRATARNAGLFLGKVLVTTNDTVTLQVVELSYYVRVSTGYLSFPKAATVFNYRSLLPSSANNAAASNGGAPTPRLIPITNHFTTPVIVAGIYLNDTRGCFRLRTDPVRVPLIRAGETWNNLFVEYTPSSINCTSYNAVVILSTNSSTYAIPLWSYDSRLTWTLDPYYPNLSPTSASSSSSASSSTAPSSSSPTSSPSPPPAAAPSRPAASTTPLAVETSNMMIDFSVVGVGDLAVRTLRVFNGNPVAITLTSFQVHDTPRVLVVVNANERVSARTLPSIPRVASRAASSSSSHSPRPAAFVCSLDDCNEASTTTANNNNNNNNNNNDNNNNNVTFILPH